MSGGAAAAAKQSQAERLSKLAEGAEPGGAEPEIEPQIYKVDILRIVKEAQSQNGLRHGDYMRYRSYCSRRLHRLRRSLNFKHGKKRYVKKELTAEVVSDERFLHIPLVNTERNWSFAMNLKEEMVDSQVKKHHMVQKMSKAAKSAYQLQKLCAVRADAQTQLEAEAYAAYMLGNLLLEKEKWKAGQTAFKRAQMVYSELGRRDIQDPDYQRMYSNMSDEITPSIMFCRYNARKHGGDADEEDDAALKEILDAGLETPALDMLKGKLEGVAQGTRAAQAQALKSVQFRGASLSVTNDKLRMAIITARDEFKEVEAEKGLDKKMDRFGRVSVAYDDAVTIVSRDLQELRSDGGDEDSIAKLQQIEIYLNVRKEQAEVDRNLVLAESYRRRLAINGVRQEPGDSEEGGKTTKPDELVGIYDKLINVVSDMLELPGVEDLDDEVAFYSARLLTFKALRCMYMGEAFRAQNSWPQAYVLYERASDLANAAIGRHEAGKHAGKEEVSAQKSDVARLRAATSRIDGLRPLVHAEALLTSNKADAQVEKAASLLDGVSVYAPPECLAPFPPAFEAVPCKPILFDLVDREFEFPMEALEKKGKQQGGWGWGMGTARSLSKGFFGS